MTGPAAAGFDHEVGFYASDDEFADLILPFARGGLESGEPVVFAYDAYKTDLLRHWLPDSPGITYITGAGPYAAPAKALQAWRHLVEGRLRAGAPRVRIAGNVPHPGYGVSYTGWDRYEAAVDRALGDLPVWAPCLYDARIAPAEVLDRARALHRHIREHDGNRSVNDEFEEPARLADFLVAPPDPVTEAEPTLALTEPAPVELRAAVQRLVAGRLCAERTDALVLAASEALTNAIRHGVRPISVHAWVTDDRLVVHINDGGSGPSDPLAGLLPAHGHGADSGRGLWIAHQLDIDVALVVRDEGFTVRLGADLP